MFITRQVAGWCLGLLAGSGDVLAEELSPRLRAATLAGLPDYHGQPFPEVVAPPPPPPPAPDPNVVELEPVTVDTTRLPIERLLTTPQKRNVIESLLPGTGLTVTDTRYGRRTVGRLFFVPVYFNLNW